MSKGPVVYVLEYRPIPECGNAEEWKPAKNNRQEPLTYRGSGSKSQAIGAAMTLTRVPVFSGLRVQRGSETVWEWTKQGGTAR
jgi:hypothetical protein